MEAHGDHPVMEHELKGAPPSAPVQSAVSSSLGPDSEAIAATLAALRRLVAGLAFTTGETPRSILEDEFKHAPSDEFWRAKLGAET